MFPRDYFTRDRLEARVLDEAPEHLFHFTRSFENARSILEAGEIRGRPTVSATENPAFTVPGPIVFVLESECLLNLGFHLYPCIWQRGAEQEAEWLVVSEAFKVYSEGCGVFSEKLQIPLSCIAGVGYQLSYRRRHAQEVGELQRLAEKRNLSFGEYSWEEWWSNF